MKVTRNTPDQLIVADVPWVLGLAMVMFILIFVGIGLGLVFTGEWFGMFFAVVGGGLGFGAFAAFVQRVQVIFDVTSDAIIMRRRSLFGYKQVQHKLSDLQAAELEETTGSKGGRMYRPVLVLKSGMSKGRHPVIHSYTNTGGPRRMVEAINSWLARTDRVDSAAAKP